VSAAWLAAWGVGAITVAVLAVICICCSDDRREAGDALIVLAAAPLWPLLLLALYVGKRGHPWAQDARLRRRIHRANHEAQLIALRREAEAQEAAARELTDRYLQEPIP
jgi:anaerobic C4-dicarboxylate transporter